MDQFESLIEDMYAAAARPELWKAVLQEFAQATSARDALLISYRWQDKQVLPGFMLGGEMGPSHFEKLADVIAAVGDPRVGPVLTTTLGTSYQDSDFITPLEMRKSAYYNELLRPLDLQYMCASPSLLLVDGGLTTVIGFSVQHAPCQGPLRGEKKQVWEHLVPHMTRAIRLGYRLQTLTRSGVATPQLERARFTLDRAGRVLNFNALAEDLIAASFLKLDSSKRLHFVLPRLHVRIMRSLAVEQFGDRRTPLTGSVTDGDIRWVWCLAPLPQLDRRNVDKSAGIAAMELSLYQQPFTSGSQILTPAERQVVERLSAGLSLRTIAAELAVSYETVRSHCKHSMHKLGVKSQAALVSAWLRQPHGSI